MTQGIHTVFHFDENDKIDVVNQYLDRATIMEAMKNKKWFFKIEVTFFCPILFFLFNDTPSKRIVRLKFSKASSKDNRSLFVFL
jgi:hypothetical protein